MSFGFRFGRVPMRGTQHLFQSISEDFSTLSQLHFEEKSLENAYIKSNSRHPESNAASQMWWVPVLENRGHPRAPLDLNMFNGYAPKSVETVQTVRWISEQENQVRVVDG
ncbi:hypothetical protein RUM44_000165 [Polyplax serrata]|uniref:Uncharacterized protein n=1 Tax=Polyplax serrata TaxID=468196 RepID=A0ABR1B4P3_POLSC